MGFFIPILSLYSNDTMNIGSIMNELKCYENRRKVIFVLLWEIYFYNRL